jgi:hypothetical protein
MASEQLEGAFRYLTRSQQPNSGALRALGVAELRELKSMLRERGVEVSPSVARAIDSLIVERRGRRQAVERTDPPVREPQRATRRVNLSWLLPLISAVALAMLLVRMNRWP